MMNDGYRNEKQGPIVIWETYVSIYYAANPIMLWPEKVICYKHESYQYFS